MEALPYVAAVMSGDSDSSSSENSFTVSDSRGAFPIYSGRETPITCGYEAKTVVDTITDDFLFETANYERSVKTHISLSRFLPYETDWTELTNSVFKDQFQNVYNRWTTKIQEIRLNTSMFNFWSESNVYKYINTVTRALEIYVTLDSILAIDEPIGAVNRVNPVMKADFNKPDLLEAQDRLRRKLSTQWLPVKFRHLILWTYQLYRTAETDQAHQYRFIPDKGFIATGTFTDVVGSLTANIDALILLLNTQDMTRISAILRSTLPEGCINSIPASCNRANFDRKHHEIFANQPMLYTTANDGNMKPFPVMTTTDDYKAYGMSVNPATDNGFAFALSQSFKEGAVEDVYVPDNDFFNSFIHDTSGLHFTSKVNQFYAYPPGFNSGSALWNRNTVDKLASFDEAGYIHLVEQVYATGAIHAQLTCMPFGYQRVYFNTYRQRLIVIKEVIREMFTA